MMSSNELAAGCADESVIERRHATKHSGFGARTRPAGTAIVQSIDHLFEQHRHFGVCSCADTCDRVRALRDDVTVPGADFTRRCSRSGNRIDFEPPLEHRFRRRPGLCFHEI